MIGPEGLFPRPKGPKHYPRGWACVCGFSTDPRLDDEARHAELWQHLKISDGDRPTNGRPAKPVPSEPSPQEIASVSLF